MQVKRSNSLIALLFLGLLASCSDGIDQPPVPDPTPAPPTPVLPPETGSTVAFVVSLSVTDADDALVPGATLQFLEGGAAASSLVDLDGDALTSATAADGTLQFTVADDATVGIVDVVATADGFLRRSQAVDLSGVAANTSVEIQMNAADATGVSVETTDTTVTSATTAAEVSAGASTASVAATVTVPASTQLLDSNGDPVSGTTISIEITSVDTERDATDEDSVAAVDTVPTGLSDAIEASTGNAGVVAVPVAVTEVNFVDDQGNEITQFSQPITITIEVPDDGVIEEGDVYTLSSYDDATNTWTVEEETATIGAFDVGTGRFPASFETDHLTFFAVSRSVPVCSTGISVVTTGDSVPSAGLYVSIRSSDASAGGFIAQSGENTVISAGLSQRFGISADATGSVRVYDINGNDWFVSDGEVEICGSVSAALSNPATIVDEDISVSASCSNDSTVAISLDAAVVSYGLEGRGSITAVGSGDGVFTLSGLVEGSTYNVSVDLRATDGGGNKIPAQTTTVSADGADETFDISVACQGGTGAS